MSATSDSSNPASANNPKGVSGFHKEKAVVITQSDYIPWKGYFDMLASADECILLDNVQFTRRDWRNRNIIKTPTGLKWLTIPVKSHGRYFQNIDDVKPAGDTWIENHWLTLDMAYRHAPCFSSVAPQIRECYSESRGASLSSINRLFTETICTMLGIRTRFLWASEMHSQGTKTDRLISLCNETHATTYISGPSARAYLDEQLFTLNGIQLSYINYEGYPLYPQLYPPFEHKVSILDLIFNTGQNAPEYLNQSIWRR